MFSRNPDRSGTSWTAWNEMCAECYTASAPAGADMTNTAVAETARLAATRARGLRLMTFSFPGGNDGDTPDLRR